MKTKEKSYIEKGTPKFDRLKTDNNDTNEKCTKNKHLSSRSS